MKTVTKASDTCAIFIALSSFSKGTLTLDIAHALFHESWPNRVILGVPLFGNSQQCAY